jgi:hypothetical protein
MAVRLLLALRRHQRKIRHWTAIADKPDLGRRRNLVSVAARSLSDERASAAED